jgi:uncharacterized Ntn-hydrolase superfamily protein
MTFSIVAFDPDAKPSPEWGVAVASKFLAVGSIVPWLKAGVGAVATQAFANIAYGPDGLDLLAEGRPAPDVVEALTSSDDLRAQRQLGIVDASGEAATFTGDECFKWAGGVAGEGFCCQGNILVSEAVVNEMDKAFNSPKGDLAQRLCAALEAGDAAGGDRRGRQSAALIVVREGGGYGGGTDKTIDLRVDDSPAPIPELLRLLKLHRLYFPRPNEMEFVPLDNSLKSELTTHLEQLGYTGDFRDALFRYVGTENLEERWSDDDKIERAVLDYIRNQAK